MRKPCRQAPADPRNERAGKAPPGEPKANRRRYYLLTHGSHLVDTARFFGGVIVSLRARLVEKLGAYCWLVSLEYADGSPGHLDLIIAIRGDTEEGSRASASSAA